jgi:peptidase M28-like protein
MFDIRIYRAALIPVLFALVVVMFSVQDRPAPLTSTLAPDAFDAKGTSATVRQVTSQHPDRPPGSVGDSQLADMVEARLQSLPGFETRRDVFSSSYDSRDVKMANVIGVLSGQSERQIVVIAHRDSVARPGTSSAADTAMLLELARASAGFDHNKTLVFVSTDGGEADGAGARRFAARYQDRGKVDSVLVLEDLIAAPPRKPYVVPWSLDSRRSPLQLQRTVELALARELGTGAGSESALGQFTRQAWPLTFRQQGPLVNSGLPALTLTAHGDAPDLSSETSPTISRLGLVHFGKAALASVLALDAAPRPDASPEGYVLLGRKVLPRWAISLLALALLAPVLAGAIDGFARAVRRRRRIGAWLRWTLAASLPFLATLTAAYLFERLGWLPKTASEALAPASSPSFAEAVPALVGLAIVFALSWLLIRPLVMGSARTLGPPSTSEAALAVSLIVSLELLLLWRGNPFAVLLLVPTAHLALMCALPERPKRAPLAATIVAAALLLPGLALLYYGAQFGFGLDVTRYGLLLLAGGGSLGGVVLVSLIGGTLASVVLVGLASREPAPIGLSEVRVRGPLTYAGPGSLGATESALTKPGSRTPRRLKVARGRSSYRPIHGSGR